MVRRKPVDAPKPRLVDQHKRVVVPKEVLEALGIDSGDYVAFKVENRTARMFKVELSLKT